MYYVEENERIVLFDEDLNKLKKSLEFMPQYAGLEVKEVPQGYVIVDFELLTEKEAQEKDKQKERERLNLLSLTKREVFLALYKDKGITPEQLKAQITDPEALIEFEYAESYFRGNPLIDKIGTLLGYTSEDLDYLFEHRELPGNNA